MNTTGRPNLTQDRRLPPGHINQVSFSSQEDPAPILQSPGGCTGGKAHVPLSCPGGSGSRQLSLKKDKFAQRVIFFFDYRKIKHMHNLVAFMSNGLPFVSTHQGRNLYLFHLGLPSSHTMSLPLAGQNFQLRSALLQEGSPGPSVLAWVLGSPSEPVYFWALVTLGFFSLIFVANG